jgi:hypothetical protein
MKRDTPAGSINATHSVIPELRFVEREARCLCAEPAGDPLTRLFIEIDFRVRRLAHRIAARLLSAGSTETSSR